MALRNENLDVERMAEAIHRRIADLSDRTAPSLRVVRSLFSKAISDANAIEVIELAFKLLEYPGTGFRFMPYELIHKHKAALQSLKRFIA